MKSKRYEGINGIKAYSIIGILLMHVLVNGNYITGGFMLKKIILAFTNLVFLFMTVSAFGMWCRYYEKIVKKKSVSKNFIKKECWYRL